MITEAFSVCLFKLSENWPVYLHVQFQVFDFSRPIVDIDAQLVEGQFLPKEVAQIVL